MYNSLQIILQQECFENQKEINRGQEAMQVLFI